MKANAPENNKRKAPDKIYACFGVFGLVQATEIRATSKDIEYIREDAFIEKAENFIYSALNDGIMGTCNIEDFLRLFKNYMKGEKV